jgi:hypothetical protein
MTWFTRLRNWQNDAANGIGIRADYHDSEDNNFALGINESLNAAGLNSPTANIPFGGFKITGAAVGTSASDYATVSQVQGRTIAYAVDSSGTDSYAITLSPAVSAYAAGQQYVFLVGTTNTGASSLNVSGLGARTIKKWGSSNLSDGDLVVGQLAFVVYDGSDFQLLSTTFGAIDQSGAAIYAADGGGTDAYVVTLVPAPASLVTGMTFRIKCNTGNTGPATINVNSLGVKSIVKDLNLALDTNDIRAGQIIEIIYDGTNFQLLSPVSYLLSQDGHAIYAADSVGTDSYAITLSPAPASLVTGMCVRFKAATANTGACSLNVNGLGATAIKKDVNVDPLDNDIKANQIVEVIYDGTNWQMISKSSNAPTITTPVAYAIVCGGTTSTGALQTIASVGTAGQVLVSNGAGALPSFGSGGGYSKISSVTASGSATVSFTDLTSAYMSYVVIMDSVAPATDDVYLQMRTSTNNGSSYDSGAGNYAYAGASQESGGSSRTLLSSSATFMPLCYNGAASGIGNNISENLSGFVQIFNPSRVAWCRIIGQSNWNMPDGTQFSNASFSGIRRTAADVDAIQFSMSSGNIATGTFTLYGITA